jgi:RHS repeat-associated protein
MAAAASTSGSGYYESDSGTTLVFQNGAYTFIPADGSVPTVFVGEKFYSGPGENGAVVQVFDPADPDNPNANPYTEAGNPKGLKTSQTVDGVTTTTAYAHSYQEVNDRELIAATILRRRVGTGAWDDLQRTSYTYYGSSSPYGLEGDQQTVTEQFFENGQWAGGRVSYYRYYTDDQSGGRPHAIKYALEPEAYERLKADPEVTDPLAASDAKIAQYAHRTLAYASSGLIATQSAFGEVESTFAYEEGDAGSTDYNTVRRKTTETRRDGSVQITYKNFKEQPLLTESKESADATTSTLDYYRYDAAGKLLEHATPSALAGYSASNNVIVPEYRAEGGLYHVGLIRLYEYYEETTTGTGGVAAKGYKKCEKIKQGRDGTPIKLVEYEYTEHTATHTVATPSFDGAGTWGDPTAPAPTVDATTYPLAREIRYRNEDGTGQLVTSYAYTWHADSLQMASRTTTLPAVPTEENGSGVAATRTELFDTRGRLVWAKDERGTITHHQYNAQNQIARTIQDVDGLLLALPDGWSTPTGHGLHLETDYEYDALGRVTQVLGPAHEAVVDAEDAPSWATMTADQWNSLSLDQWGAMTATSPTSGGQVALTVRTAVWTVYKDADREVWTAQGYAVELPFSYSSSNEPMDYDYTLVNPVTITRQNAAGTRRETIQAVRATTEGRLSATDSFPQSSFVRWTVELSNAKGQRIATRVYHTIPAIGDGEPGTHYDQTDYGYDAMGRQNRHKSPGGTITRTVFNKQGQPIAIYVGTDDTGATDADPTGGSQSPNNLVLVTEYEYTPASGCISCGGGGQGLLNALVQHVDAENYRITNYHYDWRNRQEYVIADEDAEGRVTYTRNYYDNLDRVVKVERHWQQGGFNSSAWDPDILLSRTETFYDARGQVYRTRTYAVDSDGIAGNYLEANTWYDAAGQVIKQQAAGTKAFTKTVYDSLGRVLKQYIGHDTDEATHAEAASVADDTILEQTETLYNEVGNVLFVTARRRMHNATGTGELNDPSGSQPKARTSYTAAWYDPIGRVLATANYGTGGGTAPTRPSLPPERSDEVLVTSTCYNDCGQAFATIDPAGREDRQAFDDAGRLVRTIQNYKDGLVDSQHPDEDVTVERTYSPDGQLLTLTAKNPTTGDQVTRYVYGTTLADSSVARSDLLRAEIYPDSDDTADPLGDGTDGVYDRVEYTYNRQGERTTKKDQNETVHVYDYDNLGRLIEDRATAVGSGVGGQVRRIATRYTGRGQVERITSYDSPVVGSGTVLNEVQFAYNAFNQLVEDYQNHSGAVDMVTTPKVTYAYTDGSSGRIRRTQLVYPNGRILRYEYSSGTDDSLNRVSFLADDDSGAIGPHLAEYSYLGLGQFVQVTYPEPNLRYDLAHGTGDDPYDGLDRFDRVVDLLWRNQAQGVDVERIQHGYDLADNRLWRETPVAAANGANLDELYTYDGMSQLVAFARGDLDADKSGLVVGTKMLAQQWSLDATGNWSSFKEDTDGDGTWDLDQSRSHNPVNEITQIAGTSVHVAHDRAGNMARLPRLADWAAHYNLVYDAWNRLVKVLDAEIVVAEYAYDGRDFRTTEASAGTTRHYFYASGWQILEERVGTAADRQFVWGLRYVDALVLRDRDVNGDGTLDERFYALQDANWNAVAISSATGEIRERYAYTAYGLPRFLTGLFGSRTSSSSLYNWETLYCGYRWDQFVESYRVRHRLLFSHLGRWNRHDPITYATGDPNLYQYVTNYPTGAVDPLGTEMHEIAGTLMWGPRHFANGDVQYSSGADYRITYDSICKNGTPSIKGLQIAYYNVWYVPDDFTIPLVGGPAGVGFKYWVEIDLATVEYSSPPPPCPTGRRSKVEFTVKAKAQRLIGFIITVWEQTETVASEMKEITVDCCCQQDGAK